MYPIQSCNHSQWQSILIPLSNGRPALREFCVDCKVSSSGSALGYALPMVADEALTVQSFKYPHKTLKEIYALDPEYLVWLVVESKTSDRIRKAAARIICGCPYYPQRVLFPYDASLRYDPTKGWECIRRVIAQKTSDSLGGLERPGDTKANS